MVNKNFWDWFWRYRRRYTKSYITVIREDISFARRYLQLLKAVSNTLTKHGLAEVCVEDFVPSNGYGSMVLKFKNHVVTVELTVGINGFMALSRGHLHVELGHAHKYDYSKMQSMINAFLYSSESQLSPNEDVRFSDGP